MLVKTSLVHTAQVRARKIAWDGREVVQHGLNSDYIALDLDTEWRECDRIQAVLAGAGEPVRILVEGGGFNIPSALMERTGPVRMCLIGYVGETARIVTAKEAKPLTVVESGEMGGTDPAPEQPDLWATLMEEVRKATEGAKTAAQSATRAEADLRAAAERGDFDGEDGKTPVRGVDYWTEADRKPIEDATDAALTSAGKADAAAATATEGEASRIATEAERANAEAARAEAELARGTAETGRVEAEATRAANESERTETFNANLISWNSKVDAACKKATDTASKAAQDAKTATDAAIAKTEEATNAAVAKAQTATDNATTAANKAEAAVSKLPLPLGNTLKGEVESTMVSVHDAYPAPLVTTKVMGQSNQVTTTGKNLANGMEEICSSSDLPTNLQNYCWGYSLGQNPLKLNQPLKAGTYTFSYYADKMATIYFSQAPYNGTNEQFVINNEAEGETKNGLNRYYGTVELKNDSDIIGIYSDYKKCCCGMLSKGASLLPYEPFTGGKPSPSPDYPQEITNLNKAEIIATNKNLIPLSAYVKTESWVSAGLTIKNNHDGTFSYSGKMTDNGTINAWLAGGYGIKDVLFVIPPGSYVCSGCKLFYDKEDAALTHGSKNDTGSAGIFTVTRPMRVTGIRNKLLDKSDAPISGTWKPMLEVSLEKTEFRASNYTTTLIDLKGNELCSLPNGVKDEVVIDAEGNVSLIKRTKQYSWNCVQIIKGTGRNYAVDKVLDIGANYTGLVAEKAISAVNNSIGICYVNQKMIYVTVPESVATKEQANQLCGGMKVIYQLAEPQTIPLGKVELPALPEATSNIWNDGNIPANVYVQYLKDVNIAFADLESKLTQAVVAAAANL